MLSLSNVLSVRYTSEQQLEWYRCPGFQTATHFSSIVNDLHSCRIPNDYGDQVACLVAPSTVLCRQSVQTFVQCVAAYSDSWVII